MARGRPRLFDKDEALERAMDVFWLRGYDGASMSDLAQAMALNPPSIYAAFGSKEGLFLAAIEKYRETGAGGIWSVLDSDADARSVAEHVLRRTADTFTRTTPPRGCMIVLTALETESAHPDVCAVLERYRKENARRLEARFRQARETGELPADTDCAALADFVVTVQHGMSIQARDGTGRDRLHAIVDIALQAWPRKTD